VAAGGSDLAPRPGDLTLAPSTFLVVGWAGLESDPVLHLESMAEDRDRSDALACRHLSSPPGTFTGLESMIKSPSRTAVDAAVCLYALGVLKRVGLAADVSRQEVIRRLDVARSYAYELVPKVEAALARGFDEAPDQDVVDKTAELLCLQVRTAVLEYRLEHPGCWVCGGRTNYSTDLVAFILDLASRSIGPSMTQAAFATACGVPLPTLKDWWANAARQLTLPFSVAAASGPPPSSPEPPPDPAQEVRPEPPPPDAPSPEPLASDAPGADTLGLSADMLCIITEYERWHGSLPDFVDHLSGLGLCHGRQMVTQILHLAAARKLLRRPPPPPPARGSTFRPPPGVQWTSDGKQVDVVVDDETFRVTWQPTVDVGAAATVGSVVRPEETTEGVRTSFADGIKTTGAPSDFLLVDNKACNKSPALADELAPDTVVMHSTPGRGQNKAVIEGQFGLFAQGLGPVIATVDTSTPQSIALCVADAVTRAYAQGRNHHPRQSDGRSPYDLYRDANPTPEEIAAATERLLAIKHRIDSREAREQARLDPAAQAAIEQAIVRFGFFDDGDVAISLRTLPLAAIQSAIAIYAAKLQAQSLPLDAGIRYFAGIARNCQHERELLLFEEELVAQLERTGKLVLDHLERKAASFATLEPAVRLRAIVDELLAVTAPVAQVFWRGRFEAEAACAALALRPALRRFLCERIRRRYAATKQHRQQLINLVVRTLAPRSSPRPNASPDQVQPHFFVP